MKILILLLIMLVIFIVALLFRTKSGVSKVTPIKGRKSGGLFKQPCSYCKRKVNRLAFYSNGQGKVIGVCNVCKSQAERQALMRL